MYTWTKVIHPGEKYELKINDVLLGTIFLKPTTKKYVIWMSNPMCFKKVKSIITDPHDFDTLEEAKNFFVDLLEKKQLPWLRAVETYLKYENRL